MNAVSEDGIIEGSERPKVGELIADYKSCSPMDGSWNRWQTSEEVRYAVWAGQTPDGKKHDEQIAMASGGKSRAFPFDGASDTRIFLADEVINESADVLYTAFWRAMAGQKMSLDPDEVYALRLLDYLLNEVLTEELLEEVELAAQYRGAYGFFFLHPHWVREVALERRRVALEDLVGVLGQPQQGAGSGMANGQAPMTNDQGQEGSAGSQNNIGDEPLRGTASPHQGAAAGLPDGETFRGLIALGQDREAMAVLKVLHGIYAQQEWAARGGGEEKIELPELSAGTLRQAVRDLREEGEAWIPMPYVCRDELEILCLKPWEEVLVSGSVADLRKARVYRRVFMDEVSLRRKVVEEQWDAKWVEEALKHKGKISSWSVANSSWPTTAMSAQDLTRFADGSFYTMYQGKNDLVEIVYATYWAMDEDGVPGVWCTVFHPEVGGGKDFDKVSNKDYATHGLLEEGEIPYVCGRREVTGRQLTSSRGVPEIAMGWQREKKVHRDAAVDLLSVAVHPPLNVYANAMGAKYKFGPGVQNTVTAGREPRFMEVPQNGAPLAWEQSDRVDADKRRYFGLMGEDVPPVVVQGRQQRETNAFLMTWAKAFKKGLRLAQLNMGDAEFAEITGAPAGWLEARRQAKGLFGAALNFDVRELDPEFVLKQLEVVNQVVVPGDTTGAIDRRMLTQVQLHAINPRLARLLIKDQNSASQEMFDEVRNEIAQMFLGNMPKLVQEDPTAQQKLQFAQQIVQANPQYMSVLQQQPEGRFAQLMQIYAKNLGFSVQQQKNAQIGKIGVDPQALQKVK